MDGLTLTVATRGDADRIKIKGFANETLSDALSKIGGKLRKQLVIFDFRELSAINSSGVRCWAVFLRDFVKSHTVALEACAPALVEQLNMLPVLVEWTEVRSVQIPMQCAACRKEVLHLADKSEFAAWATGFATAKCPSCGEALESLAELEAYFAFADQRKT